MRVSVVLNFVLAATLVVFAVKLSRKGSVAEEGTSVPETKVEEIVQTEENVLVKNKIEKEFASMSSEEIRNFNAKPFSHFRGDGLLLATGSPDSSNAMTIGWGGLGTLWGKDVMTVYVKDTRYTHHFMEKSPYFTVMSFADKEVLHYMGTKSGRDGDKAKALKLHTIYTENGTPYYAEADTVMECRIMYAHKFTMEDFRDTVPLDVYSDPQGGIHSEYIGEVVNVFYKRENTQRMARPIMRGRRR